MLCCEAAMEGDSLLKEGSALVYLRRNSRVVGRGIWRMARA